MGLPAAAGLLVKTNLIMHDPLGGSNLLFRINPQHWINNYFFEQTLIPIQQIFMSIIKNLKNRYVF